MSDLVKRGTEVVDAFIGDKETSRAIFIEVLKAMREPTEEMVGLGEHCADACYKIDPCNDGPRHIWQTMIDAALGENK